MMFNPSRKTLIFWAAWLGSAVLFFAPMPAAQQVGHGFDKVAHVLIFAVLYHLGRSAFSSKALALALLLMLYALAVEYIQGVFLPFRSLDLYDAFAGFLGVLLAAFLLARGDRVS